MELEHIFLAIAILTLACNIVLVIFLIRNSRLRKTECRNISTQSKQFPPRVNQPNNRRNAVSMGNQGMEEVPPTEILSGQD